MCVKDIMTGVVAEADVEKIIAGTCAPNQEKWDRLMLQYSQSYWAKNPDEGIAIANRLRDAGKIEQPRVDNQRAASLADGIWVSDESEVKPAE